MDMLVANENIRSNRVVLIGSDGTNRGEMPKATALVLAQQENLDLVQVGGNAEVPICKIVDIGKLRYTIIKGQKGGSKAPVLKEMRFHLNTSEHDIETKMRKVREFLSKNHRVKMTIEKRKKENRIRDFKQTASELLAKHILNLSDACKADSIKQSDGWVCVFLNPCP